MKAVLYDLKGVLNTYPDGINKRALTAGGGLLVLCFFVSIYLIISYSFDLDPYPSFNYHMSAVNWVIRLTIPVLLLHKVNRSLAIFLLGYAISNVVDEVGFNYYKFGLNDQIGLALAIIAGLSYWWYIGKPKERFTLITFLLLLPFFSIFLTRNDIIASWTGWNRSDVFGVGDVTALLSIAMIFAIKSYKMGHIIARGYLLYAVVCFLGETIFKHQQLEIHEMLLISYIPIITTIASIRMFRRERGMNLVAINLVDVIIHSCIAAVILMYMCWQLF